MLGSPSPGDGRLNVFSALFPRCRHVASTPASSSGFIDVNIRTGRSFPALRRQINTFLSIRTRRARTIRLHHPQLDALCV